MSLALTVEPWGMPPKKQPPPKLRVPRANFIKQWRKYRGLTLEKLAEKSGVSVSSISNLENRKQGYSWESLEALADALECDPADLLSTRPGIDDAFRLLWTKLNPTERERWLRSLRAFAGDDTRSQ